VSCGRYSVDEIQEALRPIASLISKSEKALQKLAPGTWQHTMLRDNLKALDHACNLMGKEVNGISDLSRDDLEEAIRTFTVMINKTEKAQAMFAPGTAQHTLQRNRLKALRIAKGLVEEKLQEAVYMSKDGLVFADRAAFRSWLMRNHKESTGIWMVFGKSGKLQTLTAADALEEALCFGWIDGQIKSLGDEGYLKRFTPRRKGSKWSERNRALAQKLIEQGLMTSAGQEAIDEAKKSGMWYQPRPEPITEGQVGILIQALAGADKALANFKAMSPSVQRTYTALYLDAKSEETRKKRLGKIIARLNENKKPMD
jgi:uncharacterized protein YdeI (YjbR/CyaY-like superfamily)